MSWASLTPSAGRAGRLACACDAGDAARPQSTTAASAAFALTIMAQALATATLPLAGAILAPTPLQAALPYALTLLGAAIATFPAAALTDAFGRRAALAMGASLGLAGGAIAARGFAAGQFFELALGAFWLGVAQGFGFFHRHEPAGGGRFAIGLALAAGCLGAMLAPAFVAGAQYIAGPQAPALALAGAGLAQASMLALAVGSGPTLELEGGAVVKAAAAPGFRFVLATLSGALAWFAMAWLMSGAAPAMFQCGIGDSAAAGLIANHFVWMYAPAAFAGLVASKMESRVVALVGLLASSAGLAAFHFASSPAVFALAMSLGGAGWSLTTLGSGMMIQNGKAPARRWLAAHDFALFAAAAGGALAGAL